MGNTTRHGVFETNSSSTHSLVIASSDMLDIPLVKPGAELIIYRQAFGWEVEDYNDSLTKIAYMAEYGLSCHPNAKTPKGELFIDIVTRVVREVTGAGSVVYSGTGYIDHQSVENNQYHYLFLDEELLKKFLFNPESILHTDNDNH